MLKIGVLGLGNIAQKAYLSVFSGIQDQAEFYLSSRNETKLKSLQAKYRFPHVTTNMDELLEVGLDAVFIHTPTATHYTIIKKFLTAGINVYVDKPVSEDLLEVDELYKLAEQHDVQLTAGFNRRFAPYNQQIRQITGKQLITVEKTRVSAHQPVQEAIYDLFIHVVDTALFLANITTFKPTEANFSYQINADAAGILTNCSMTLKLDGLTVLAKMNMQSGVDHETATIESSKGIATVTDLETLTKDSASGQLSSSLAGWTPMLTRRGFEPLINEFIHSLSDRAYDNPVSPASSVLSHQLCQLILDGTVS